MRNTGMTNRQKKALETKIALFESAITLFKEKGFDNVYIEDIAEKAGTSKGSFYTYFKSKDEVIIEHYKQIDGHYEKVFKELPSDMDISTKLVNVLQEGIIFSEKLGPEFLTIVLYNQLMQKDKLSFVMNDSRKIFKIIHHLIEEGQLNGEFKNKIDTKQLADMLWCFYKGLYLDWCLLKGQFNFTERSKKELTIFIKNIFIE